MYVEGYRGEWGEIPHIECKERVCMLKEDMELDSIYSTLRLGGIENV